MAEIEVEEGYFKTEEKTSNGTWMNGKPLKIGTALVKAVLKGTKDIETGELVPLPSPLQAEANMEIFEPIMIEPKLSVFPWDPMSLNFEQVAYSVLGTKSGTSSFIWSSMNSSVASITQNGVGKTQGNIGEAQILASMNKAHHNQGQATIIVTPVVGIEIMKDQVLEVEVGSQLVLPLKAWGKNKQMFTKCDQLPFATTITDKTILAEATENIINNKAYLPDEACGQLNVQGLQVGFTKIAVSYSYTLPNGKAVKVGDSITVAVYDPLQPVQPYDSATVVLSVGSTLDIVWSGGPQPWIFRPDEHFHNLELQETTIEVKEQKSNAGIFVYQVGCNQLGESEVELSVGNPGSHSLPKPMTSTSTVKVICAEPDKLHLEANPDRPDGFTCPMIAKTGRISVLCFEDLKINVSVFDSVGRRFDNFSTLDISWDNSDLEMGELEQDKGMVLPELPLEGATNYRPFALAQGYQIFYPKSKPGTVDISASLKKSSYLMGRSISDVLQLQLVNEAEIMPKKNALFNHPDNSMALTVLHGSGFFDISSVDNGIIQHKYSGANRSVHLNPITEGSTNLKAQDLCLRPKKSSVSSSFAQINVIGIHKVELKVIDKVELGTQVTAQVSLSANRFPNLPLFAPKSSK